MKKRSLILLLVSSLILGLAAAEAENLVAPFPAGSAEAALTARIAEVLELTYIPVKENSPLDNESRAETANHMLQEPGTFLCDTQSALIAGLQGYTAEDLRTAMVPVCRIARCPLYLVMDAAAAEERGISAGEDLLNQLAENEYDDSLLLARHVEADPEDRAAVFLSEQLPLLTELFWPAEVQEALRSGDAALAVYKETELDAAGAEVLALFTLGGERTEAHPEIPSLTEAGAKACPEPALYLMAASREAGALSGSLADKITGADLAADCLAAGFIFDPLSGSALEKEISEIFADYKEYMTAEGLFFYEQD